MDKAREAALPSYEPENAPSYEQAPAYDAAPRQAPTSGLNLTIDPTGMFITALPASDAPPLYTVTKTLLHVSSTTSIHVKRADAIQGGEVAVYAIGQHFISPLHSRKAELQNVTAARSHGLGVWVGLRKVVWDFSTHVAPPKTKNSAVVDPSRFPVDPVYMIGTAPGPGTVVKHLLQFSDGKWEDDNDEVVALEREGGAEVGGMPVLSVMKDLDVEKMDFLVSAWLVTLWEQVGKRAHRSKSDGGRSSIDNSK